MQQGLFPQKECAGDLNNYEQQNDISRMANQMVKARQDHTDDRSIR